MNTLQGPRNLIKTLQIIPILDEGVQLRDKSDTEKQRAARNSFHCRHSLSIPSAIKNIKSESR